MTWWGDNLVVTTPELKIRRADTEFIGAGKNLCGTFTWNHSTQHLPALLGCKSFVFHVSTIERAKLLAQTWQDVVAYRRTARPWARLYVVPHRCSRLSRRTQCRPVGVGPNSEQAVQSWSVRWTRSCALPRSRDAGGAAGDFEILETVRSSGVNRGWESPN